MHIIFGKKLAEELREKYFLLELETFKGKNTEDTAFCVLPAEAILNDMSDLDRLGRLHQAAVDAWNRQDYDTVIEGISHLKGKFSGELDSFYEELENRIGDFKVVQ